MSIPFQTVLNRRRFIGGTAATVAALGLGTTATTSRVFAGQATPEAVAEVSASALEDLRARLRGTLMLPGDSGYAKASSPANGRYAAILPVAVTRCADEGDVQTCIRWCNDNGVAPVGRGGGHSYAGYSTTTGLLIDLRRLNRVTVNRDEATVTCGGAALNNDFFVATENGPLFLPGGTCLGVGIGGLTLGGGIGYNTHWAGLTADHLTGTRMVTATGDVVEASEAWNSELYWASRGGAGGSFGLNTEFSFNLLDAPQHEIAWYRFDWMGDEKAIEVIEAYHQVLAAAPAAFNGVAMSEATAVGDDGPRAAIHTMSRGQYIGPLAELEELIAPLIAIGDRTAETLTATRFWDIQRMIASDEPPQHNFGDMSRYATEALPSDVLADVIEHLVACPYRDDDANGSFWSLGWVGGEVVSRFARSDTAYVHRDAFTLLRPTTVWPTDAPASVGDELNAWTRGVIETISPYTPDESYQNFPNRDLERWETQYWGENLDRLVDVKTAWDPDNLFNNPQSVPTRAMLERGR